jgi:hypothetical protein
MMRGLGRMRAVVETDINFDTIAISPKPQRAIQFI